MVFSLSSIDWVYPIDFWLDLVGEIESLLGFGEGFFLIWDISSGLFQHLSSGSPFVIYLPTLHCLFLLGALSSHGFLGYAFCFIVYFSCNVRQPILSSSTWIVILFYLTIFSFLLFSSLLVPCICLFMITSSFFFSFLLHSFTFPLASFPSSFAANINQHLQVQNTIRTSSKKLHLIHI